MNSGLSVSERRQTLGPWFSIWIRPRLTVKQVLESSSRLYEFALAALAGLSLGLYGASLAGLADWSALVAMSVGWPWNSCVVRLDKVLWFAAMNALAGIASLEVGAVLLRLTGKPLGGNGSHATIRTALAWSQIPLIWMMPLGVVACGLLSKGIRQSVSSADDARSLSERLSFWLTVIGLLYGAAQIWSFIVRVACVREVQRFSIWKAIVNSIVAGVLLAGLIVLFRIVFSIEGFLCLRI